MLAVMRRTMQSARPHPSCPRSAPRGTGILGPALLSLLALSACCAQGAQEANTGASCKSACSAMTRCSLIDGICQATEDDCRRSIICRTSGACHAVAGTCTPLSEKDCATAEDCALSGLCGFDGRSCVGTATGCESIGEVLRGNRCHRIASASLGCKQTIDCTALGDCSNVLGVCLPDSDQDCLQSSWCFMFGMCHVTSQACIVQDESDCRTSYFCGVAGACSLHDGRCVATSDIDCASSKQCVEYGFCHLRGFDCAP